MATFITFGIGNIVGAIFAIIFNLIFIPKTKGKTNKEKLSPIKYVWILLIILEILKITYHIYFYNGFSPSIFPILYCSMPLYLYGIILFADEKSILYKTSYVTLIIPFFIIGFVLLLIYPDRATITEQGVILNFHSRFYHMVIMGVSIYLAHIKCCEFDSKTFFGAGILSASYFLISGFLSVWVGGAISYFSPYSGIFDFLFNSVGYLPGLLILCFVVFIIVFIIYQVVNLLRLLKRKQI